MHFCQTFFKFKKGLCGGAEVRGKVTGGRVDGNGVIPTGSMVHEGMHIKDDRLLSQFGKFSNRSLDGESQRPQIHLATPIRGLAFNSDSESISLQCSCSCKKQEK